jgi:hypothetical protein
MRTMLVVVGQVLGQNVLEMATRDDEEEVEALLTHGPHTPLGVCVQPSRRSLKLVTKIQRLADQEKLGGSLAFEAYKACPEHGRFAAREKGQMKVWTPVTTKGVRAPHHA